MARTALEWLSAIDRASKAPGMDEWDRRCKIIKKKYLNEGSRSVRARRYQLLWSNIQQLQSAIYSKAPKGVVRRRFLDQDRVALTASQMLERSINFTLDYSGDYHTVFKRVRDDFLLYARGIARIYYEPTFSPSNDAEENIADAEDVADKAGGGSVGGATPAYGGDNETAEVAAPSESDGTSKDLEFENVRIGFLHRQDFVHEPGRVWEEVTWVGFRSFMTKKELTNRFPGFEDKVNVGNEIDTAATESEYSHVSAEGQEEYDDKAAVWEIWDKKENSVCWVARGCDEALEEGEPYLKLDGFYPCPAPAYGTLTNDSIIPIPDYVFYQDQADEIDQLTARIGALTDALKLVGFYPAGPSSDEGFPEIEKAFTPGFENKMIAVQSWAAFKEGGNGGAPVVFLPVVEVGKIIEGCVKLRQQIVQDVYQITGISDIMRGATDPNETAQAQQMKAQFGGVRLRDRQTELARFCSDIVKLVGQVIAVHCQPSTIEKMSNIKLPTLQQAQASMAQYKQQIQQMVMQYQQKVVMAAHSQQGQMPQQGPPGPPGQPPGPPGMQQQGGQVPPPPQIPPPPDLGPTEEDVFGLLRDNVLRAFRIDIEAESTVAADEQKERADRVMLIESFTKFMQAWGPMVQVQPMLSELTGALLNFGIRSFRVGRELEEVVEKTVHKFEQQSSQNPGAGKQDPKAASEAIKIQGMQIKAQAEIQKSQIDAQIAQMNAQAKLMEIQFKAQSEERKIALQASQHLAEHNQNVVAMHTQAQLDAQARQHEHGIASQQAAQQAAFTSDQSSQDAQQQQSLAAAKPKGDNA